MFFVNPSCPSCLCVHFYHKGTGEHKGFHKTRTDWILKRSLIAAVDGT